MPAREHTSLISMSAFNGLLAVRHYSTLHPATPVPEVIEALRRVSPDDAYNNYDAAIFFDGLVAKDTGFSDAVLFFRAILSAAIQHFSPWWIRLSPFGRERLSVGLTENERQCFDAAGLFVASPGPDVLRWWDDLAQRARGAENDKRITQGREAERLTIDYETKRLNQLGIASPPRWIALDDNGAGYDVHSFDQGPVTPIAKLIEVKSCVREDLQIFLTRNEWETAVERAPHYRFHIWLLPDQKMLELTPDDLAPHVPQNRGSGRWENARISVAPSSENAWISL